MMKKMLFITSVIFFSSNVFSQEQLASERFLSISGGPQIKYQNLSGIHGLFLGGAGSIRISKTVSLTAQGVLLINDFTTDMDSEKESVQFKDLQSGYGGIGIQLHFLSLGRTDLYGITDLIAGGYRMDNEQDINFKGVAPGLKVKIPINRFMKIEPGISVPFFLYADKSHNNIYQSSPVFTVSLSFGGAE